MVTDPSPTVFRFRGFELDLAAYQLRRHGKTVRLERRPMDLLVLLVTRHGHLVPREEIVERLWPPNVVIDFDTGLNTLVRKVRHALQDSAEEPECIETVPGKGYRFIAPVDAPNDGEAPNPTSTPQAGETRPGLLRTVGLAATLVLAAGLATTFSHLRNRDSSPPASRSSAETTITSVAVLPFADLSAEQDQQHFSDGLSEEIINLLAQSQRMRVIARTSSFSFRNADTDIATVAKKLNVTHVLEGSVRKSGDRLRITAQLIDAKTSSHLWSRTYDRKLDDIFEVQEDIAASVAQALQVALQVGETNRLVRNAEAYEHFLQAQFLFQRRAPGDVKLAAQRYRQSVEVDPAFARAWAGLASAHWILSRESEHAAGQEMEMTRDAAERALVLDPNLAEAHLRLANYYWIKENYLAGDEHKRKAFELEPNNSLLLSFAASDALRDSRIDEAIVLYRRVVAADPLSALHRHNLASYLFMAERHDEARQEMLKALELNPATAPDILGFALILDRKPDEALLVVQGWPAGAPRTQCLALIYHALGRGKDADEALAQLIEIAGASEPSRIAEVHAYRNEFNEAFHWLNESMERGGHEGSKRWPVWIKEFSPFLKPLHSDERWGVWVEYARAVSPR